LLGRLLAFELLQRGHRVSLFDPAPSLTQAPPAGDPTRAAGWTAAGMLSPTAELECANEAVFQLGLESLRRWPGVVDTLRQTGHDVALTHAGSLLLAHRGDEGVARRVLELLQKKSPLTHSPKALSATELKALEPDIHGPAHTWLLPHEGHIHTVQAMAALGAWALAHGATFHGGEAGRVLAVAPGEVHMSQGNQRRVHRFDHVFDVRGVGARPGLPVGGNDLGFTPQVRGVRGEIFWLHAPGVALHRPVRLLHPRWRVYLVPRPGNLVVVGATEIESEDRSPVSVRSTLELLSAAHSVLPGLAEARVVHSEANLRPALPDNLPAHTHQPGLSRINGLFRHGWLIAPALVHQALGALYSIPPTTQTAPATPSPTPVSAA
jgi:glycine oxidase